MSIRTRPATKEYRDNWETVFVREADRQWEEKVKARDDEEGARLYQDAVRREEEPSSEAPKRP